MPTVVVTRHNGLVEWLRRKELLDRDTVVLTHVKEASEIAGKTVYGVLPLHLAAVAKEVYGIDLPNLPEEKRGKELTPDEMDSYGASLKRYVVLSTDQASALLLLLDPARRNDDPLVVLSSIK